jgi:hypothetical protein
MPQALAAALVQVFLQGVAWGTFGEAQAKLEGVCSPPDATKTPSRLDVWPCLAITSGAAHFLCAPFAAVLVQRKIRNADVQMIALATGIVGSVLLLTAGITAPPADSAPGEDSYITSISVSRPFGYALSWMGVIVTAASAAMLHPLLAILTADQVTVCPQSPRYHAWQGRFLTAESTPLSLYCRPCLGP